MVKMTIVIEEGNETLFWIEIIKEKRTDYSELNLNWKEGNELTAIFVSTIKSWLKFVLEALKILIYEKTHCKHRLSNYSTGDDI